MNSQLNDAIRKFYFENKALLDDNYTVKSTGDESIISHKLLLDGTQLASLGLHTDQAVYLEFFADEEYAQLKTDYNATGNPFLKEKLQAFDKVMRYNYVYDVIHSIKITL